jgi:hypothetical protein
MGRGPGAESARQRSDESTEVGVARAGGVDNGHGNARHLKHPASRLRHKTTGRARTNHDTPALQTSKQVTSRLGWISSAGDQLRLPFIATPPVDSTTYRVNNIIRKGVTERPGVEKDSGIRR